MNKRNWKVVYSDYSGMEKKAIELVSSELGSHLNRDSAVFTLHVLPCIKTTEITDFNAVVIGCYDTSELVRKYIAKDEIPENGYIVKVIDNPENENLKIMLVAANDQRNVFYGAVELVDDYFSFAAPHHGGLKMVDEVFTREKLPDYCHKSAPKFKTRSVFTWGQPIIDYRNYIDNLARLRFNQIIIWNDFVPVNANDVVDYAHEYGIEVIWGYSWGWRKHCKEESYLREIMSDISALKKRVIDEYEEKYNKIKGDGVYFQSFTETGAHEIDGKVIAETVADFVNETADELLKLHPGLHIQFGLHATSVQDKLKYIAKVDSRVEIVWEDCGAYPYDYSPSRSDPEIIEKTKELTQELINLRDVNPLGLVFKGQMTMDWNRFENQSGPYILGMENKRLIKHDYDMMKPIWREFQAGWIRHARKAYNLANMVLELTGGDVNMNLAATLSGGIWLPYAITAELFWDPTTDYDEMMERVAKRRCIEMA